MTSPVPSFGSATSSITSGDPKFLKTAAFTIGLLTGGVRQIVSFEKFDQSRYDTSIHMYYSGGAPWRRTRNWRTFCARAGRGSGPTVFLLPPIVAGAHRGCGAKKSHSAPASALNGM